MRRFVICAVALSLLAMGALAETIEKTDGTTIEARIISEAADALTIETSIGGITMRQRLPRKQIKSIRRIVKQGPGYCIIPLEGMIGREVTADALEAALAEARKLKASIIILTVNSPGGLTDERDRIVEVIRDNNDLQFIAHVTKALSAASTITLACPKILMSPEATMGAAVVYTNLPDGTPKLLEEKYQSAMRARERVACMIGGHDELWARGMREGELELAIVLEPESAPKIIEVLKGMSLPENAKVIKKNGKILTLTAREAVQWGLANAEAVTLGDIRKLLGHATWHNAGSAPATLMANRALAARVHLDEQENHVYEMEKLSREVRGIDEQLARLSKQLNIAEADFKRLQMEYDRQIDAIAREYQAAMAEAKATGSPAKAAKARDLASQKASAARGRYEPLLKIAQAIVSDLAAQYNKLVDERLKIITTARND